MISKRLKEVARFVSDNSVVVDVGCDHGLLDIFLHLNRTNIKIVAVDIKLKNVNKTIKNLEKYNLNKNIEVILSDGLKNVKGYSIDTIIVAGIGGKNIIKILDYSNLKEIKRIILQPTNNNFELRKFMMKNNFYVAGESLIMDRNKLYTTILFEQGDCEYSFEELYFGPILIRKKSDVFVFQTKKELLKLNQEIKKIPIEKSNAKSKIYLKIKMLEEAIK